jgi:mycofactocin precursor
MTQPVPQDTATDTATPAETHVETTTAPAPLAVEALVEEVSIDGMCGVY